MDYIDPIEVSPAHYRLLLENERVRVLAMTLPSGEKDEPHSHPAETVYFVQGGEVRLHLPEGETADAQFPNGGVMWHEPWTHQVVNVGDSDIEAVIVEDVRDRVALANEELAERFHMEVFQDGDLSVADVILSDAFVIHAPGYPEEWTKGPDGAKALAQAIIEGLPEREITHHDVLSVGDKVLIRWLMTGIHGGELMGVPATGNEVSVAGFDLFRIEDDQIVELWQNWDQLGLLQQIGAIPSE